MNGTLTLSAAAASRPKTRSNSRFSSPFRDKDRTIATTRYFPLSCPLTACKSLRQHRDEIEVQIGRSNRLRRKQHLELDCLPPRSAAENCDPWSQSTRSRETVPPSPTPPQAPNTLTVMSLHQLCHRFTVTRCIGITQHSELLRRPGPAVHRLLQRQRLWWGWCYSIAGARPHGGSYQCNRGQCDGDSQQQTLLRHLHPCRGPPPHPAQNNRFTLHHEAPSQSPQPWRRAPLFPSK